MGRKHTLHTSIILLAVTGPILVGVVIGGAGNKIGEVFEQVQTVRRVMCVPEHIFVGNRTKNIELEGFRGNAVNDGRGNTLCIRCLHPHLLVGLNYPDIAGRTVTCPPSLVQG
jgi:hypothetical protein